MKSSCDSSEKSLMIDGLRVVRKDAVVLIHTGDQEAGT